MSDTWNRNSSGCINIANTTGKTTLDVASSLTMTFGLWIVVVDSVANPNSRDFSMLTVSIKPQSGMQEVKHNKFSHLRFDQGIDITFEAETASDQLFLYGTTSEAVNYTIYRFWSNYSYSDTIDAPAGTYGSSTTVPQILIDSYGRLVDVQDVIITPAWGNITGKPTTVALSGLVDALSTSSVIECGNF